MKRIIPILLLAAAVFATSCSSSYRSARHPSVLFELNSADYTLSEPVSATVHVTKVLGINFAEIFDAHSGDFSASVVGTDVAMIGFLSSLDKSVAIHDLLEKNPGYDFVLYPQFTITGKYYLIYSSADVTVTARLGKLVKKN